MEITEIQDSNVKDAKIVALVGALKSQKIKDESGLQKYGQTVSQMSSKMLKFDPDKNESGRDVLLHLINQNTATRFLLSDVNQLTEMIQIESPLLCAFVEAVGEMGKSFHYSVKADDSLGVYKEEWKDKEAFLKKLIKVLLGFNEKSSKVRRHMDVVQEFVDNPPHVFTPRTVIADHDYALPFILCNNPASVTAPDDTTDGATGPADGNKITVESHVCNDVPGWEEFRRRKVRGGREKREASVETVTYSFLREVKAEYRQLLKRKALGGNDVEMRQSQADICTEATAYDQTVGKGSNSAESLKKSGMRRVSTDGPERRGRGRPRGKKVAEVKDEVKDRPTRRGPGRPRKNKLATENVEIKNVLPQPRKRGRPKKNRHTVETTEPKDLPASDDGVVEKHDSSIRQVSTEFVNIFEKSVSGTSAYKEISSADEQKAASKKSMGNLVTKAAKKYFSSPISTNARLSSRLKETPGNGILKTQKYNLRLKAMKSYVIEDSDCDIIDSNLEEDIPVKEVGSNITHKPRQKYY